MSGKPTLTRGSIELEGALKDGAEGCETAEVGNKLEASEQRETGEGVCRNVFAETKGNSHW